MTLHITTTTDPAGALSQLPAGGGAFRTAKDRFGFLQHLLAVLMQRAILPGQRVGRILHKFPAALVEILALLYQLLTCVDQIIRNVFSLRTNLRRVRAPDAGAISSAAAAPIAAPSRKNAARSPALVSLIISP
jgi:hypothetical protein